MILDASFNFGIPADCVSGTAKVSPNVYYVGATAKKIFTAGRGMRISAPNTIINADDPGTAISIKVDFVAADNAPLTTNPVVLGSSGTILTTKDGTVIQGDEAVDIDFEVRNQRVAKKYYGLMVTIVGDNLAIVEQDAYGVIDTQTNMLNAQAAVPAT